MQWPYSHGAFNRLPLLTNPSMQRLAVLALDVEGTLVSNGVSQFARPGLAPFLAACRELADSLILFTSCNPVIIDKIQRLLVAEGTAPPWFVNLRILYSPDGVKDLERLGHSLERVAILDDQPTTPTEQRHRWVCVPQFQPPFSDCDDGLSVALKSLRELLATRGAT